MSADNLALSTGSGVDQYTAAGNSGFDGFTKGAGTQQDGLSQHNLTLVTDDGSVTDEASTIPVQDTSLFPASGSFTLQNRASGEEIEVDYTGKTATSFTGCTIAEGEFEYETGDTIYA